MTPDQSVVVCNSEITEHRWLTPGAALDLHHAREFALAPPQFVTLSWLADFARAEHALRELPARPLVTFRPLPLRLPDGMCMLYEGDAGYAARDPFAARPWVSISKPTKPLCATTSRSSVGSATTAASAP